MNSPSALKTQTENPVALAFQWLLNSGIQDHSLDEKRQGGVTAWFDLRTSSYPFIYAEITGYAVNAFLFQYERAEEKAYLNAAEKAADWLISNQHQDCGLVRTRLNEDEYTESYYDSWVFTFDQWIIVYGLACLAEKTAQARYLNSAVRMADFLLQNTVREDGFFYPVYNVVQRKSEATGDKWSRQPGSFHVKALMALEKLALLTGNRKYLTVAHRLAEKTLSIQEKDGRFVTQDNEQSTHLHPHLYTLEGLTLFGVLTGNESYLNAAEKGLEWVFRSQLEDGRIYSFYKNNQFLPFVRADILAQSLRMGSLLILLGRFENHCAALDKLRTKLLGFQILEGAQAGGFFYGLEQDGTVHYHVNAWVSMFAAQALAFYEDVLKKNKANLNYFV